MKRVAFKPNTKPMDTTGALRVASASKTKLAKCKVCKANPVARQGAKVCGIDCSIIHAASMKAKAERIKAKTERLADKQKLEQYKPLEYWLKKAESACNEYIRLRDPDICISCGVTYSSAWQAGHYISVGANKTLRYHEDNIHKQCIQCNMFKGSNATPYRINLLERIGLERVEWLESWHSPLKMTREAAQEIEAYYKLKLKQLKSA